MKALRFHGPGDLPLEAMLERYEAGTKLVEICQAKLAAAESERTVCEGRWLELEMMREEVEGY